MIKAMSQHGFTVLNFLLIKVAWFACVLGGSIPGAVVVSAMLALCIYQGRWQRERPFVLALAALGLLLDSAWIHFGILDFGNASLLVGNVEVAPLWILLLWVAVGLSLFEALGFFVARPFLGALIVGAVAPVSYSTGAQFGAVTISSFASLIVIALVWVIVFAVVFESARRVQQTAGNADENEQQVTR
ncbi:MAG: DUF2878 domain-containing protein [Gammaproteobacteria bacterium TMED92]|nr:MAG: DUF2878 domain-containing protein [Gammaproteobacteria bacterium TMED92]